MLKIELIGRTTESTVRKSQFANDNFVSIQIRVGGSSGEDIFIDMDPMDAEMLADAILNCK